MNVIGRYGVIFVILLMLQIFILNGMSFLGYATPFVYVYFLLKLPSDTNRNLLILLAFLMGMGIDIFSNTPGVNAAASVFVAFLRPYLINAFVTLDVAENREPSINLFGFQPFLRFSGVFIFIHHTLLLLLESFSLFNLLEVLLRLV